MPLVKVGLSMVWSGRANSPAAARVRGQPLGLLVALQTVVYRTVVLQQPEQPRATEAFGLEQRRSLPERSAALLFPKKPLEAASAEWPAAARRTAGEAAGQTVNLRRNGHLLSPTERVALVSRQRRPQAVAFLAVLWEVPLRQSSLTA